MAEPTDDERKLAGDIYSDGISRDVLKTFSSKVQTYIEFIAVGLAGNRSVLTQKLAEAREQAEGWRNLAVAEGLGEGDGEDRLPWESGYLQPDYSEET